MKTEDIKIIACAAAALIILIIQQVQIIRLKKELILEKIIRKCEFRTAMDHICNIYADIRAAGVRRFQKRNNLHDDKGELK